MTSVESVTTAPSSAAGPGEPVGTQRAAQPGWWRGLDVLLRVCGGTIAVVAALLSGVVELLLAPVRVGGIPIGVAVPAVVLANIALGWFAPRAVGSAWGVALPAVPWFVLMVVAAVPTAEGDLLLAGNNVVGLLMVVAGAMTFAVMAFRLIIDPESAHRFR